MEQVAPEHVQFSTGNDWFIGLAKLGKHIDKFGYLLGDSQMSPRLFKEWREAVEQEKVEALAIEPDPHAATKDFWTPGNVGMYRHYLGIFLSITGLIAHPLPHPQCEEPCRVKPEAYFIPLTHAIRLGLVDQSDTNAIVKHIIPDCQDLTDAKILRRVEWMG